MKKLIRLNGKAILNLHDMQQNFDATALCDQADVFLTFAGTHCVALPAMCGGGAAQYVTKSFWYQLLAETADGQRLDDADECFAVWAAELADRHMESGMSRRETLAEVYGEMAAMMLPEKLDSVLEAVGMDDVKTAMMLLAICELCEMDAREQNLSADGVTETAREETACEGQAAVYALAANGCEVRHQATAFTAGSGQAAQCAVLRIGDAKGNRRGGRRYAAPPGGPGDGRRQEGRRKEENTYLNTRGRSPEPQALAG